MSQSTSIDDADPFGSMSITELKIELNKHRHIEKELLEKSALIEQDLKMAAEFQHAVLPPISNLPYLKTEIIYQPHGQVSGDVYDFLQNRERELGIFLGDATGHGMAAALMTMMAHLGLDTIRRNMSTDDTIRRLNQLIASRQTGKSITGIFIRITPRGLLTATHAAHPALIIIPRDGSEIIQFEKGGCALGIFEDEPVPYEEESIQLQPGDRFIAYTDGLIEWKNADQEAFEVEKFIDALDKHRGLKLDTLSLKIKERMVEHAGGYPCPDDLTILLFEFAGE